MELFCLYPAFTQWLVYLCVFSYIVLAPCLFFHFFFLFVLMFNIRGYSVKIRIYAGFVEVFRQFETLTVQTISPENSTTTWSQMFRFPPGPKIFPKLFFWTELFWFMKRQAVPAVLTCSGASVEEWRCSVLRIGTVYNNHSSTLCSNCQAEGRQCFFTE